MWISDLIGLLLWPIRIFLGEGLGLWRWVRGGMSPGENWEWGGLND